MSYDLCEELIIEILSRLPSKSLLRFRSLSKSLCASIGPEFIRLHTLRSPKKVMITHQTRYKVKARDKHIYTIHSEGQLLSDNPYIGIQAVKFPFTDFKIFGSCNGILCVLEYEKDVIHLWNPSIRRKVTVDVPEHDCYCRWSVFGFGFDPMINDYKILRITNQNSFVYTMKTDTWCEIAHVTTPFYFFVNLYICLFNGALYWPAKRYLTDSHGLWHYYIRKFDLSSEVFSAMELPEPSWEISEVTIIKGSLAAISTDHHDHHSWIWVMSEENNNHSWSVAFKLETNEFKSAYRVLQIAPNEELLCLSRGEGILVYNPARQSRLAELSDSSHVIDMNMCVESLELLDMGTLCDQ